MDTIFEIVRHLSVASLGIFAGAMLTEGAVLVPYWRSLGPAEFFSWYAANGQRLLGFFGPLTWVTGLTAIAAAFAGLWEGHPGRWLALVAAMLVIAVVSTFYLYFQKANASFSSGSLSTDKVAMELTRWATWHWWRTGLSFAALTAALLSVWLISQAGTDH